MIEESKYCTGRVRKRFNIEFVITKEEGFEISTNRGSTYRDYIINANLNDKI